MYYGQKKQKKRREKKLTDEIRRDLELVLEVFFCVKYFYIYCLFALWCGRSDIIIVILILVGRFFILMCEGTPSDDIAKFTFKKKHLYPLVSYTQLSTPFPFINRKFSFLLICLVISDCWVTCYLGFIN